MGNSHGDWTHLTKWVKCVKDLFFLGSFSILLHCCGLPFGLYLGAVDIPPLIRLHPDSHALAHNGSSGKQTVIRLQETPLIRALMK